MADTDLSKIVGLIMENPALIEQIRSLTGSSDSAAEGESDKEPTVTENESTSSNTVLSAPTSAIPKRSSESIRRKELLCALKPYVSEGRSKAIDSIISIAEILDVIKR